MTHYRVLARLKKLKYTEVEESQEGYVKIDEKEAHLVYESIIERVYEVISALSEEKMKGEKIGKKVMQREMHIGGEKFLTENKHSMILN